MAKIEEKKQRCMWKYNLSSKFSPSRYQ